MIRAAVAAALAMLAGCGASTPVASLQLIERDVVLMGTRTRLAFYDRTRAAGLQAADHAVAILEQTEAELTTWRDDSLISRLNRHPVGAPFMLPDATCLLFAKLAAAVATTGQTFDPAIGRLTAAWDVHGGGRVPGAAALAAARASSGWRLLALDPVGCRVTRNVDVTIDVGAFGKGEALDRVRAAVGGAWLIDLGGQVAVSGAPPGETGWRVSIAHPGDRGVRVLDVVMAEGSLATSGGSERDLSVDGRRVSHLLDPRTGGPVPFDGSVSVWHRDGLQADVLSTALYVMGPGTGSIWARERGLAAAYFVPQADRTVRVMETPAFARLRAARQASR